MGKVPLQPSTCTDAPHHGIVCTTPFAGARSIQPLHSTCHVDFISVALPAAAQPSWGLSEGCSASIKVFCLALHHCRYFACCRHIGKPTDHAQADCFRVARQPGLPLRQWAGTICTGVKLAGRSGGLHCLLARWTFVHVTPAQCLSCSPGIQTHTAQVHKQHLWQARQPEVQDTKQLAPQAI